MFNIKKMGVGLTSPFVYLPATSGETIVAGEALVLSSGKLTKCGATAKPAYVALGPDDGNGTVPCVEVQSYMECRRHGAERGRQGDAAHRRIAGHGHDGFRRCNDQAH